LRHCCCPYCTDVIAAGCSAVGFCTRVVAAVKNILPAASVNPAKGVISSAPGAGAAADVAAGHLGSQDSSHKVQCCTGGHLAGGATAAAGIQQGACWETNDARYQQRREQQVSQQHVLVPVLLHDPSCHPSSGAVAKGTIIAVAEQTHCGKLKKLRERGVETSALHPTFLLRSSYATHVA
jgi:hypothetical protein